jgi:hypothetical protein
MPTNQLTGYGTLDVAQRFGISTEMVRYWAKRGLLPAVKLDGRLYFDRVVIDKIANARSSRSTAIPSDQEGSKRRTERPRAGQNGAAPSTVNGGEGES